MPIRVPLNSLVRHVDPLAERLTRVAQSVIRSGYYVLGPSVRRFEEEFASYCGVENAIGVANGTDALELALRALEVGPGDEVAVVANAGMYSTTAVLACGATPVYIDVDASTHTMSARALDNIVDRGLKATIVTHLYGRLADMAAIMPVCERHGISIVEDCAQAHGAETTSGRKAGSLGDIACFSFYPTKNLGALGDGGAIVTSSEAIATRVKQLRQYGWSAKYTNELLGGRNSRLDELQAAMLSEMLPELDRWNERRREIANRYSTSIRSPVIAVPPVSGAEYVAHLYVVTSTRRDELRVHLESNGVQTDVHYPIPDYKQPALAGIELTHALPVTENLAATIVTLPCFPELTDEEVDVVIDACNRF